MKTKRYIRMSQAEQRLALLALTQFRNSVIQRGIDPIDIDRLLVKLTKARKANVGVGSSQPDFVGSNGPIIVGNHRANF